MMDLLYIGLTVGVILQCIKGPVRGIAALAFVLPISDRLPSLPIPLLNTQNLLILGALASLLMARGDRERFGGVRFPMTMLVFILFLTIALLNTVLTFEPVRYERYFSPYAITVNYKNALFCLLIYVLGGLVARSREDLARVLKGLLLGMAAEAAFVCLEVFMSGPARANGHMGEGNSAGAYLAWSFCVALGLWLMKGTEGRWVPMTLGIAAASLFGLLFTLSRGNYVAAIAGAGAIAVVRDRRFLVLLVVALAAHQLWVPDRVQHRLDETVISADRQSWQLRTYEVDAEGDALVGLQSRLLGGGGGDGSNYDSDATRLDTSSQIRLYVWQAALRMIADHPLGVGMGLFQWYLWDYSEVYKFRAVHNTFLLLGAETGILGLLSFVAFLLALLWESWRVYWTAPDPQSRALGLACLGSTLSMIVSACFYNFFFQIPINGQQWLLLGLMAQARGISVRTGTVSAGEKAPGPDPSGAGEPVPLYRLLG